MNGIRLYGSLTSPYVRRVRILLAELALSADFIDTTTETGQTALREVSPLWRIPVMTIEAEVLLDSAVICRQLLERYGPGPIATFPANDIDKTNLITVIDGALDSLINAFYLQRDGADRVNIAYLAKQHQRAASALGWLEERAGTFDSAGFDLSQIALITALDWTKLRGVYPIERHPALLRAAQRFGARASIASTTPS